jgi:hypothetical protein
MIRTAARACFYIALSASAAQAADTEIRASFGQTFQASDNRKLVPNSPGDSYSSISTLVLNAVARTARSTFEVIGNLAYRAYAGSGEQMQPNTFDRGILGIATYRDRYTKYFISGSYQQRDASTVQIEEDGFSTLTGYVNTTKVIGGIERQLTATDSVSLTASGTMTDFTTPTGIASTNFSTRAAYSRKVNRRLDWIGAVEYQRLTYDNATDTLTQIVRASTGVRSRLSPRLAVAANVGVNWANTDNQFVVTPTTIESGPNVGLLADLLVTYNLMRDTIVVFSAGHSFGPNSLGELTERSWAGLSMRHEINDLSYWLLSGQFTRLDQPTDGETNLFVTSATYGMRLGKDWRTELSYLFRHKQSGFGGDASSNTITFRVSRDLVLLP